MNHKVVKRGRHYAVRYRTEDGRERQQTTGKTSRRAAERWAADFMSGLGTGEKTHPHAWGSFRQRYERERLAGLPSAPSYRTALDHFERIIKPRQVGDGNTAGLTRFRNVLFSEGFPATSVASYVKHVRAALGWAYRENMLSQKPSVQAGSTAKMRGKPIAFEEFERMLAVVPRVVGRANDAQWRRVLWACWTLGLRRSEVLKLAWDDAGPIRLDGLRTVFFPAHAHKAGRDVLLPLLPDAVKWLAEIPKSQRTGFVFGDLRGRQRLVRTANGVGRTILAIGKKANVVVGQSGGRTQFAGAQSLRQSLGTRLAAAGLNAAVIQAFMRHASYETTMAHYTLLRVDQLATLAEAAFKKVDDLVDGSENPSSRRVAVSGDNS